MPLPVFLLNRPLPFSLPHRCHYILIVAVADLFSIADIPEDTLDVGHLLALLLVFFLDNSFLGFHRRMRIATEAHCSEFGGDLVFNVGQKSSLFDVLQLPYKLKLPAMNINHFGHVYIVQILNDRFVVDLVEHFIDPSHFFQQIDHEINIFKTGFIRIFLASLIFHLEIHTFDLIDLIVAVFIQFGVKISNVLTESAGQYLSHRSIAFSYQFAYCRDVVHHFANAVEEVD